MLFKIRTQLRSGKTRCGRALQEQELISLRAQELEMVKELCPRMAASSTTRTRFWMRRCWRAPRAHTVTLATVARGAATKRVEQEDEEEEKRQAELRSGRDLRMAQRLQVALGCRCTQRMELEKFPLETWAS